MNGISDPRLSHFFFFLKGKDVIQVVSKFKSKKMEQTQVIQESDENYPTGPPPDLPDIYNEDPKSKPDIFTGDSVGRIKVGLPAHFLVTYTNLYMIFSDSCVATCGSVIKYL